MIELSQEKIDILNKINELPCPANYTNALDYVRDSLMASDNKFIHCRINGYNYKAGKGTDSPDAPEGYKLVKGNHYWIIHNGGEA